MARLFNLNGLVFSLVCASSVGAASDNHEAWLFVQTSSSLEALTEETLTLPFEREIFGFTDRPYRKFTYLNLEDFLMLWADTGGDTFQSDPPNAVLTWFEDDGAHEVEIEILSVVQSEHGKAINYEFRLLSDAKFSAPRNAVGVSLFIDDFFLPGGDCPWSECGGNPIFPNGFPNGQ